MLLHWLACHGVKVTAAEARIVLRDIAQQLSAMMGRQVTPWEVDHAIWLAARSGR
ncbi:hypothetical protein [Rhodococcus marinonascens]|uniref:hypothetical protein n=1 Tax=Rhodococcus marinonascens TaxID=38311 RepID=UPI001FE416E2|nr:hypothetical protein [Rhodococcus marinonascens]